MGKLIQLTGEYTVERLPMVPLVVLLTPVVTVQRDPIDDVVARIIAMDLVVR